MTTHYWFVLRFGKVFKSHLFGSPAIVSCDRELNMFILQNDDKLFKVSYPKAMHGILGSNSLIIAAGDTHRKLRSVVVSFISWCKSKPTFLHCVDKLSVSLMESWRCQNQVLFCKQVKMVKQVQSNYDIKMGFFFLVYFNNVVASRF